MFAQKLRAMWHDREGVSPVIGVILMVAVTVVLAAVIGAFVFGMGDSLNDPAPNSQFELQANGDVVMTGGETLTTDNTGSIEVSSGDRSAGDTLPLAAGDLVATGAGSSVEVTWTSPDGGTSQVIAELDA